MIRAIKLTQHSYVCANRLDHKVSRLSNNASLQTRAPGSDLLRPCFRANQDLKRTDPIARSEKWNVYKITLHYTRTQTDVQEQTDSGSMVLTEVTAAGWMFNTPMITELLGWRVRRCEGVEGPGEQSPVVLIQPSHPSPHFPFCHWSISACSCGAAVTQLWGSNQWALPCMTSSDTPYRLNNTASRCWE